MNGPARWTTRATRVGALAIAIAGLACKGGAGSDGAAGPQGPQGPPGPVGATGPAGAVVFGSTAGTAAEGNDPRLSDARDPKPGSAAYIQNAPASPQAASVSVTGDGAFGGAVTAASFSGNGAGLTSLNATNLTGTVPMSALPVGVALLASDNTFTGANAFRDPVNPSDAATKRYVDSAAAAARPAVFFTEQSTAIQVLAHSWTPVPGAAISFATATTRFASLLASGSVEGVDPGSAVGTCGFRFVVDGVGYGDGTWGDRLVQCGASPSSAPSWCSWTMERLLSLPAGPHTFAIEAIGFGATGCFMGGGSYSNAKLLVTAY